MTFHNHQHGLNIHPISLKKIGLIYLLIAVITLLGQFLNRAWGAELLEAISFEPASSGVNVVLQTTSNPPYRVVYSDDKKVTLVIENVDPAPRLQTDVSQMSNIRYVAAKPLGAHGLQIDIYGDSLGHPFVTASGEHDLVMAAMVQNIPNPPSAAKPVANTVNPKPVPVTTAQELPEQATADTAYDLTSLDASLENVPLPPIDTAATQSGTLHNFPSQSVTKPEGSIFETSPFELIGRLLKQWHNEYLFILALCIGAGLLVVFALNAAIDLFKQINKPQPQQAQANNTQPAIQPKQKQQGTSIIQTMLLSLRRLLIPQKSRRQLSAFQRLQNQQTQGTQQRGGDIAAYNSSNGSRKTMPASLQGNRTVDEQVARQQAQSAYRTQQQSQPPSQQRPQWKNTQQDAALEREMKRSLEMKYSMGMRDPRQEKPTPQPKNPQRPGAQPKTPIAYQPDTNQTTRPENRQPNNPLNPTVANSTTSNMGMLNSPGSKVPENNKDVVNFLKSVAELMEKDGKKNLADEIKKTLQ